MLACVLSLLASTDAAGRWAADSFYRLWHLSRVGAVVGNELIESSEWVAQKSAHVVIFGALGYVAIAGRPLSRSLGWLGLGLLICLAAELAQLMMHTRNARWSDALLNVISYGGGAVLTGWLAPRQNDSQSA